MTRYSTRIGAMHLKDVHADQVSASKAAGASYHEATRGKFTVWTEPGRGDIDLLAALAALPNSFNGWMVVEVDVPEAPRISNHENFRRLDCQTVRPRCVYR
jgi:inosose dehydratase